MLSLAAKQRLTLLLIWKKKTLNVNIKSRNINFINSNEGNSRAATNKVIKVIKRTPKN